MTAPPSAGHGLVSMLSSHLAVAGATAALLALFRAASLEAASSTPEHHFALAFFANLGLALALGVVATPVVALAWSGLRARFADPTRFTALVSVALVVIPFWWLNTPLGFHRPLFAGGLGPVVRSLAVWLPTLALLAAMAWRLLAGREAAVIWSRAGAVFAGCAALAGLAHAYGVWKAPSPAPPLALELRAENPHDVFLVLVDTLRADHLTAYGYPLPTSPNVDALAEDATLFERGFAHAPWTRPSCASLLTGRYPPDTGVQTLYSALPRDVHTLPQLLRASGYETAGIISSVQLSGQFGFDKGFDLHDIGSSYLAWSGLDRALGRLGVTSRDSRYPRYDAAELTDEAIDWLEARPDPARPVFMYLHYSDPHGPYGPPADSDRWRDFASERARRLDEPPRLRPRGDAVYSAAEFEAMIAAYDSEIAYFDLHFGRLLAYLRASGRYDDALIVLTSDHGEEFLEHDGWEHGHTLFNEQLHVPLVLKYPARLGEPPGRRVETPAGLVDVLPTVQDVVDAEWPSDGLRGRSLLDHGGAGDRTLYADTLFVEPSLRGLVSGTDKIIQTVDESGLVLGERHYSLEDDFGEQRGARLEPGDPAFAGLREMLAVMAEGASGVTAERVELSPETRKELQALGYLE